MASVAVGGTLMADSDRTSDEERVVRKQTSREVRRTQAARGVTSRFLPSDIDPGCRRRSLSPTKPGPSW